MTCARAIVRMIVVTAGGSTGVASAASTLTALHSGKPALWCKMCKPVACWSSAIKNECRACK